VQISGSGLSEKVQRVFGRGHGGVQGSMREVGRKSVAGVCRKIAG